MDYEKKYIELLGKAAELKEANPSDEGIQRWVEDAFPELIDKGELGIRDEIINYIKQSQHSGGGIILSPEKEEKWISWLENQEEQRPYLSIWQWKDIAEYVLQKWLGSGQYTDGSTLMSIAKSLKEKFLTDCKPHVRTKKFYVGEWVVDKNSNNLLVKEVFDDHYRVVDQQGMEYDYDSVTMDVDCDAWSLIKAKEDDVLVGESGNAFIFSGKFDELHDGPIAKCGIKFDGSFAEGCGMRWSEKMFVKPATKVQRDILFKKMKEAGYEWDAEKKEPKNLEQKPADWSEEDKKMIDIVIDYLKPMPIFMECYTKGFRKKAINWLKSIKDRYV